MQGISSAQAQHMLVRETRRRAELQPRHWNNGKAVRGQPCECRQSVSAVGGSDSQRGPSRSAPPDNIRENTSRVPIEAAQTFAFLKRWRPPDGNSRRETPEPSVLKRVGGVRAQFS